MTTAMFGISMQKVRAMIEEADKYKEEGEHCMNESTLTPEEKEAIEQVRSDIINKRTRLESLREMGETLNTISLETAREILHEVKETNYDGVLSEGKPKEIVPPRMTPEEKEAVDRLREEFKDEITPYYDTDFNLLRWLIGHHYDMEIIRPKLHNHLLLRNFPEWQLDIIARLPRIHPVHQFWKEGITGEAGPKTPRTIVNIDQSGHTDWWGMLSAYPTNEILKARVYDLESMLHEVMKKEAETGERWSFLYVMDLTGLKYDRQLISLCTGPLVALATFMQENYVEMFKHFVLVAAPGFMSVLWNLVYPILPEDTRKKVVILGSNWREEIRKMADDDVLPMIWNEGGKEEPFKAHIDVAIPVPKEVYHTGTLPPYALKMTIKAGGTGYIEDYAKEGQLLCFEVNADGRFDFAGYYSADPANDDPDTTKWEKIIPLFQKIPGPTLTPMKDCVQCPKTGTYRCWVSNEHAWWHALKVVYTYSIEDPPNTPAL